MPLSTKFFSTRARNESASRSRRRSARSGQPLELLETRQCLSVAPLPAAARAYGGSNPSVAQLIDDAKLKIATALLEANVARSYSDLAIGDTSDLKRAQTKLPTRLLAVVRAEEKITGATIPPATVTGLSAAIDALDTALANGSPGYPTAEATVTNMTGSLLADLANGNPTKLTALGTLAPAFGQALATADSDVFNGDLTDLPHDLGQFDASLNAVIDEDAGISPDSFIRRK
jgi:hypothetical protein